MSVYMTYNNVNIWSGVLTHFPFVLIEPINWHIKKTYNLVNNQAHRVIVKVIADYNYISNVIDYDYIVSGNGDYDYLR